jgi:class 3 adenylate cyclase
MARAEREQDSDRGAGLILSGIVILSEAKDLAREWFDLRGQDPSVASLLQDDNEAATRMTTNLQPG